MKVADLIKALEELNPEAEILLYDAEGDVFSAEIPISDSITFYRTSHHYCIEYWRSNDAEYILLSAHAIGYVE